ncbi:hypothetical protein PUNSTDRAFT_137086 [Punctularia strigosozonata HHB-11173 SS5]|uniref:uncharacterized protein n=1 Tax=Punctularia strigosozonata (strain HHB-11173) TaxID=741275 RepID=UPI000441627E|nr:uncharacterized protein PUNSTDRAFT_137086 [Punctularia strigosozonata HHB-11173 SS5]EIN06308.1 hypothetical protein PUNSTDRAFT_137086 [Punctularia strigosozonata HHB-11173 SS5]
MAGVWRTKNIGMLWSVIYKQGIIWVAIPIILFVPAVVLVFLNLNDIMNIILLPVYGITLCMAVARMYRDLSEFSPGLVQTSSAFTAQIRFKPVGLGKSSGSTGDSEVSARGLPTVIPLEVFQRVERSVGGETPEDSPASATFSKKQPDGTPANFLSMTSELDHV